MTKNRTQYQIALAMPAEQANNLILQWLQANKFKSQTKDGETYFIQKDAMTGNKYFSYQIQDKYIYLWGWVKMANEMPLDDEFTGSIPKASMKSMLNVLLGSFNQPVFRTNVFNIGQPNMYRSQTVQVCINSPATQAPYSQSNGQIPPNNMYNTNYSMPQSQNVFSKAATSQDEKLCEVSFWISFIGLLLPLIGFTPGGLLIFFEFYCAIKGLHTQKKGKAIATIVIASISAIILLLNIIGMFISL